MTNILELSKDSQDTTVRRCTAVSLRLMKCLTRICFSLDVCLVHVMQASKKVFQRLKIYLKEQCLHCLPVGYYKLETFSKLALLSLAKHSQNRYFHKHVEFRLLKTRTPNVPEFHLCVEEFINLVLLHVCKHLQHHLLTFDGG